MKKRRKLIKIIIYIAIFLITIGISYQIFSSSYSYEIIENNKIQVIYDDDKYIKISNLKNLDDKDGLKIYPYHFSITNAGEDDAFYRIKLIDEESANIIERKHIRFNINSGKLLNMTKKLSEIKEDVLYEGKIKAGAKNRQDFYIRLWISSSEDLTKSSYKGIIKVEAIMDNGANF